MFKIPDISEALEKPIIQSLEEEAMFVINNKDNHTLLEFELAQGIMLLITSLREVWNQKQSN